MNITTKLIGTVIIALLSLAIMQRHVRADRPGQLPTVVIIQGQEAYGTEIPYATNFTVQVSTDPRFKIGDPLADALTLLRMEGKTITANAYGYLLYTAQ